VILDFTYNDSVPWPEWADGIGPSMISVEVNPEGDPNDPYYWTSSSNVHGSPFVHDVLSGIEEKQEIEEHNNMQLYPNPTSDLLMVQSSSDFDYISTLPIYDLRGRVYYQEDFTDYMEVSLNGLNMSPGIYVVEIVSVAGKETKKVMYTPR